MEPCYRVSPRQEEDWHRNYTIRKKQAANVMSFRVDLPGDVNIALLEQAYSLLLHRHEGLRTFFPQEKREVKQQIAAYDPAIFGLQHIDSADPEALSGIRRRIMADLKNLKKPPLVRGVLWKKQHATEFVFFI